MPEKPRIVIAEDDVMLSETMRDVLEEDFTVETVGDGQEAIRVAHRDHPDVMVLDAQMPLLDGLSACRALRDDPRTADVQIIVTTGASPAEAASRAFDAGATDFIAKPFSVSQLRARAATCAMRATEAREAS